MPDRISEGANWFETTLTAEMNGTALTATVADTTGVASPAYIVIEPDNPSQREVMYMDDTFTATTFVTTDLGNRYLSGSGAGSGLTHPNGSVVRVTPLYQHIEDLHDRITADEGHTVASHGDTTATGAELNTLTDGSNADALHAHVSPSHTVASHSDTTATGAELETLTDGSNADALHSHAGTGAGGDTDAIHDNVANEITAVTLKASPVSADEILIEDSAAGYVKKSATLGTLPVNSHTVASHSDTTATGAELETLTDGSNADALHTHAVGSHTIASHSDTTATGAELETLTDGSDADALHTHSADGIDTSAIHDNQSGEINALTEKTTPVDADLIIIEDSEATNAKKKVQISNLPGGGGGGNLIAYFSIPGDAEVKTYAPRWYHGAEAITLVSVSVSATTAPTGANLIADVLKNGTSVFGTRPTITAGQNASTQATPTTTSVASTDYIEIAIDQIGSTVAGADVVVSIEYYLTDTPPETGGVYPTRLVFQQGGALSTGTGARRFYFDSAFTVSEVWASVSTAPTGASLIADINKNGTTIFTTQGNRPEIAASAFRDTTAAVPDVTSYAAGDYLTVDIDQVGSTVAGSDLLVIVKGEYT